MRKKKLLVIDANSVIHRAYHALPPLSNEKGEATGAAYGFLLVFLRAVKELSPDFIAVAFDFPAPTNRHRKYKKYKAKRPKAPEDLYSQIPFVKDFLKALKVSFFEKEGFEADDLIGTIAQKAKKSQFFPGIEIIIASGDKDMLQLVDSVTKVYLLRKGVKDIILYDKIKVKEKYGGLLPKQLVDYKALRGDPSDNIPGVTGIGEKTAIDLVRNFGDIESLYKKSAEGDCGKRLKERTRDLLAKYKEQAFLSLDLAKISKDAPIEFFLESCSKKPCDKEKLEKFSKNMGFKSLPSKIYSFEKEKRGAKLYKEKVDPQRKLF